VAGDTYIGGTIYGGDNGNTFATPVIISSIVPATSLGSGALVVGGGVSIYGSTYISSSVTISDKSSAVSIGSGALVVSQGGASIKGDLFVGGRL
jgi:microcystin-dependent protein